MSDSSYSVQNQTTQTTVSQRYRERRNYFSVATGIVIEYIKTKYRVWAIEMYVLNRKQKGVLKRSLTRTWASLKTRLGIWCVMLFQQHVLRIEQEAFRTLCGRICVRHDIRKLGTIDQIKNLLCIE